MGFDDEDGLHRDEGLKVVVKVELMEGCA